jgi:hypothetical protein
MLWFFKYFCQKIWQKIGVYDSKQSLSMLKFDHNIGFWENDIFSAENCLKSQKIVFIASTPVSAEIIKRYPVQHFHEIKLFLKLSAETAH